LLRDHDPLTTTHEKETRPMATTTTTTNNTTIIPERLARFEAEISLRSGPGSGMNGKKADMCALQAADWLAGGDGSNEAPECVCPVIAEFVIGLNDGRAFRRYRDLLKPFVPKILGTRGSLESQVRRAQICAKYASEMTIQYHIESDIAEYVTKYEIDPNFDSKNPYSSPSLVGQYCAYVIDKATWVSRKRGEIREACLQCLKEMIAVTE
jgi:hypothetical protein